MFAVWRKEAAESLLFDRVPQLVGLHVKKPFCVRTVPPEAVVQEGRHQFIGDIQTSHIPDVHSGQTLAHIPPDDRNDSLMGFISKLLIIRASYAVVPVARSVENSPQSKKIQSDMLCARH